MNNPKKKDSVIQPVLRAPVSPFRTEHRLTGSGWRSFQADPPPLPVFAQGRPGSIHPSIQAMRGPPGCRSRGRAPEAPADASLVHKVPIQLINASAPAGYNSRRHKWECRACRGSCRCWRGEISRFICLQSIWNWTRCSAQQRLMARLQTKSSSSTEGFTRL